MAEWKERCEELVRDRAPYASGHKACGALAVFASYPPRCGRHGGIRNYRLFNFLRSQGVYMPLSAGQLVEALHARGFTQVVDAPKVYGEKVIDGIRFYAFFTMLDRGVHLEVEARRGERPTLAVVHSEREPALVEDLADLEARVLAAMRHL